MQQQTGALSNLSRRPLAAKSRELDVQSVSPREICYSTLSVDAVEKLIITRYDCGNCVEGCLFSRGINDVYSISSPKGRFALRVSRANWRPTEAIAAELMALEYIVERGVNVAAPIRRSDGELITLIRAPEGLRQAVLFDWIDGHVPKYTDPHHARLFGEHLATLHGATDGAPLNAGRPRINSGYLLEDSLELIRSKLHSFEKVATPFEALVERLSDALRRAESRMSDWGFCHGDVANCNASLNSDRVATFDYDFCGTGWRIYDLACYNWDARREGARRMAWPAFLDGYLRVRPFEVESLEFINLFTILRHLWAMKQWIILSSVTGKRELPDELFEDVVSVCESIESDSGERS